MDIKYVEITEELSFTEAALAETPPEENVEEKTETESGEGTGAESEEDLMDEALFTEAALVEPIRDKDEIKAIAGLEARKAGAVAATGAQAIAIAMEKREAGVTAEEPRHYDSFADLEAVEMMAIEMVKKEQAAKSSPAAPLALQPTRAALLWPQDALQRPQDALQQPPDALQPQMRKGRFWQQLTKTLKTQRLKKRQGQTLRQQTNPPQLQDQ